MAKPTRVASSPPGRRAASRAKTGNTKNKPSMRKAKMAANEALARRSVPVMRKSWGSVGSVDADKGRAGQQRQNTIVRHGGAGLIMLGCPERAGPQPAHTP